MSLKTRFQGDNDLQFIQHTASPNVIDLFNPISPIITLEKRLFSDFKIPKALLTVIDQLGYKAPTPIQEKSLPYLLKGEDIIAKAKTGSGKTVAFSIGILNQIHVDQFKLQSLVICPTRELCQQVATEIRKLARFKNNIKVLTLCGGQPLRPQINSLSSGAHIVVGTPGRLKDHLKKKTLKLNALKTLVLDEADRMLDMGFFDDIQFIIDHTPGEKQSLLFSATYPDNIKQLSSNFQKDPVEVEVASLPAQTQTRQIFYKVKKEKREEAVIKLLRSFRPASTIIFCNMKYECKELNQYLKSQGISSLALHGDLKQKERNQVLAQFSNQSCNVLVATDVAARGIDIKGLGAVINYALFPKADVYIHRIGRTGRVDQAGLALSLFLEKEKYKLDLISTYQDMEISPQDIDALQIHNEVFPKPTMSTLVISGGKKQKIRPGDILGALTGNGGIEGCQVGKISVLDVYSFVAVKSHVATKATRCLLEGKIKKKNFRVTRLK